MADIGKIYDGLEILIKHNHRSDFLQAEHDELYAGSAPDSESEDGKKLIELGWRYNADLESWSVFT